MRYSIMILFALLLSCNKAADIKEEKQPEGTAKKAEVCDTDFEVFFKKFAKDSLFQEEHVKFPLKVMSHELDANGYGATVAEERKKEDYVYVDFTADAAAAKKEYDRYVVETRRTRDSIFYTHRGTDNGIFRTFKFVRAGNCWYLVAIDDHST